jgi:hypothetical protein
MLTSHSDVAIEWHSNRERTEYGGRGWKPPPWHVCRSSLAIPTIWALAGRKACNYLPAALPFAVYLGIDEACSGAIGMDKREVQHIFRLPLIGRICELNATR